MCKKNLDSGTPVLKSTVYYDITPAAEESRKKGTIPFEFGPGIVDVIDELYCSEEQKRAIRYDLEHNYELRTLSYCNKCAALANFMQICHANMSKKLG